ncbi:MAG: phosphoribosylaminoimidazolesuccinocarboxamide synthase, partial [Gemmatimonadota bacterium]|nr:phosphoribosylaminoimidazolesuccinocarboxamide synthase [Gemmatimonadota bacterium]
MTPMLVGNTDLPLERIRRGKVRDVYAVDADRLLLVASDRVSAFDVVMNELVPYKGAVLTQITAWWLRQFEDEIAHHMLSTDADAIARDVPALAPHVRALRGRTMLCRRTEVFPIECVIRGYISGSAWKEYQASGTLAGEPLPAGLTESAQFPRPV